MGDRAMNKHERLIEILMPMEQASILSPREKNVRSGGYISTFHVWPARRPLAACRAALLATLIADPREPAARTALVQEIGGAVTSTTKRSRNDDGALVEQLRTEVSGGLLKWDIEEGELLERAREAIRHAHGGRAPRVFDPFAGGGSIPLEAMGLGCEVAASDLNPVAWLLLKGTLEYPKRYAGKLWLLPDFVKDWSGFLDDFQSGGRKRRAKRSHFSEPVPGSFKEMLQGDLRWHVRAWGRWVLERARAELSHFYPVIDGEPAIAYLWARTAVDPQTGGRLPILKTFVISRKKGARVAILPVPDASDGAVSFRLLTEESLSTRERRKRVIDDNPLLERWGITPDTLEDFLARGTLSDAGVWSPFGKGRPDLLALTMAEIAEQGRRGDLGNQMTAVCVQGRYDSGNSAKRYRLPTETEIELAKVSEALIVAQFESAPYGMIDESLPPQGSLGFRVQLYGIVEWSQLFTPRQLLSAGVFLKHTRAAIAVIRRTDPDHAEALAVYLTVVFGRFLDYNSTQCTWEPTDGETKHTIAGYKLPMIWDFAEANPLSEVDRYYAGGIRAVSDSIRAFVRRVAASPSEPVIACESSLATRLSGYDLCFTDPPYYDAIPYSDLMNYFRIWQKRILGDFNDQFREVFARPSPSWDASKKDGELIDDDSRFGGDAEASRRAYEEGMTEAFRRSLAALNESGRMVVVFANKEVKAWQSLVSALVRSGAMVTASWPIQTEMTNKVTQKRANLSTSVWIVCQKRSPDAPAGWEGPVVARMKTILFEGRPELGGKNILRYFFDLNVRGADFLWAALGPALAAYSEHPYVKKTKGGYLEVAEFLDEVRKLVLQFALASLPGFDDLRVEGDGAQLALDPVTQYYLLHREAFGFEPVLAGACILYATACGTTDRDLQIVWNLVRQGGKKKRASKKSDEEAADDEEGEVLNSSAKADKYQLVQWDLRVSDEHLGEEHGGVAAPLIDQLHRLMYLLKKNRPGEVQAAYDEWGLKGEPTFPRLLQAVRELALEDHQAEEQRLVESLASQLKMNRTVVTTGEEVRETLLFDNAPTDKEAPR